MRRRNFEASGMSKRFVLGQGERPASQPGKTLHVAFQEVNF